MSVNTVLSTNIDSNTNLYVKLLLKSIDNMMTKIVNLVKLLKTGSDARILVTELNINLTLNLVTLWTNILRTSEYASANTELINRYDTLLGSFNKALPENALKLNITGTSINELNAFKNLQLTQFQIIGDLSISKLQRIIVNAVTQLQSVNSLIKDLLKSLLSNLKRYATAYANTSQSLYIQQALLISAQNFKDEGILLMYLYVGPEDNTTRLQCLEGLSKHYFTLLLMNDFLALGLRWNCRHIFIAIDKDIYNKLK